MTSSENLRVAAGISLPVDVDKDNPASFLSVPDSDELVTLKSGGECFTFSKPELVKDSEYFRACLSNPAFIESRTSTIEFYDIVPEVLEGYLHIVNATATGKPIETAFILASSEKPSEASAGLIFMIKVYRLCDRFLNQVIINELGQFIVKYIQEVMIAKVDRSTPEGVKWLVNTYKNAYNALDSSNTDQASLQFRIADTCGRTIALDEIYDVADTSSQSKDFVKAVLSASSRRTVKLSHKVCALQKDKKILKKKRVDLKRKNKAQAWDILELLLTMRNYAAALNHIRKISPIIEPDSDSDEEDDEDDEDGDDGMNEDEAHHSDID
ncbi:hypothetical protein CORC01_06547 [Colletotrichum orchidophilum]|uniref:BTB domain-containing protein n=1 Tax=Colletotrichum orchidophilum TaxID=1209926 RepID=A0A1G4B9V5_9PEZI|nr:uncharacterized protein CORC01_06547 [Colletotrichum orchidophilum]OHE98179.1 hypothetical protein CORC01_06547 [Colletotrichum orchidophilum]